MSRLRQLVRISQSDGPHSRMERAETTDREYAKQGDNVMNRIATALLIGALSLAPGIVFADEEGHSLEQVVVEMAHTPQQHAALAEHYRAKANEARSEMRRHEKMAGAYGRGNAAGRRSMKSHCEKISKQQAALAQEYDALAKLHKDEGKAE